MIQTFDIVGGPDLGRRNLPRLRAELAAVGLTGFLVPHEDEYLNEYLPEANERLLWTTGFSGSAGLAIITADACRLIVDGRYTAQAKSQTDAALVDVVEVNSGFQGAVSSWLREHAAPGAVIGYDPRLHGPDDITAWTAAAAERGLHLRAVGRNPLDAAWTDRPAAPETPLRPHAVAFAGEAHGDKRRRLGAEIAKSGADCAVLTSPVSIAWTFNLRADDVRCTPAPLGRAILRADGTATLFLAPAKVTPAAREHLGPEVTIRPEAEFDAALGGLGNQAVRLDPATSSAAVFQAVEAAGGKIIRGSDPCALPRACKNAVELEGARIAHRRDGVAMAKMLHWLDTAAQDGKRDEIECAGVLEGFRAALPGFVDLSFFSISAAGPNGAFPHYHPDVSSNAKLRRGSLYLIDSGAQFAEGTTDITRVVPIGRPTAEMRARYTLVLKGHIALAVVRFPKGTSGHQLDAFARAALWSAGLDYDHGTGHGVGSYLSVHEGPHRIAKVPNSVPLEPGMIVSNEPGYYKPGGYGIRIETLQAVTPPAPIPGGEREMLGFETLTLAPLSRALIDRKLLTPAERAWIDGYHARVLAEIGPQVSGEVAAWLADACAPLGARTARAA